MEESAGGPEPSAPPAESAKAELNPIAARERIELIDILRGLAIFGILLVNMEFFFAPIYLFASGSEEWWPGTMDQASKRLILFFAQGKFYSMFSFLFGVGAAVQLQRAQARGRRFGPFFGRRMLWLSLIGLSHGLLIWFGDILLYYALTGFVLILFVNRSYKTLLVWTVILFVIPLVLFGAVTAVVEVIRFVPEAAPLIEEELARGARENAENLEQAREVYATGSYSQIAEQRLGQWGAFVGGRLISTLNFLALFLIGLNLGRRDFFRNASAYLPRIRRWIPWLLVLGILCNTVAVALHGAADPMVPSFATFAQQLGLMVGGPALCFVYVLSIVLLAQRETWRRRLAPLGAVGRMALTNYLMHSVVFTTLANGYGFGLYGKVSPSVGLLITVAMFLIQIPLSSWWLRRFRFGPVEWIWRSLTYGRLQTMWR